VSTIAVESSGVFSASAVEPSSSARGVKASPSPAPSPASESEQLTWPRKFDVFGVNISATTYSEAQEAVLAAARIRRSATVTHISSHGLCAAARDPKFREVINDFDIAAPDGQPVRWTLKWFHKQELPDRCYGPELMIRLCRAAAKEGISIYLYGSTQDVLDLLSANLKTECPGLIVAGVESPPFRKLSEEEVAASIQRINDSGAGLVFIGLGCPRQDVFAKEHKHEIKGVQLAVGAAFDFHAGTKKTAPRWMQRNGLEWFFRLTQEPTRLWKRYLVIHTTFAMLLTRRLILGR
jgi:N-acetylglucosaminyldiphosphoundecaprenol N-acetyl-beta-D-mannosaminyltransferase